MAEVINVKVATGRAAVSSQLASESQSSDPIQYVSLKCPGSGPAPVVALVLVPVLVQVAPSANDRPELGPAVP
jgi:hypothetical protein